MSAGLKTTQLDALIMGDAVMMLRDIGRQLRRVKSKDTRDKDGVRCVWHQSRLRTELSSWETPDQKILRQELCFFGQVVEFREGQPIRTGTIPNNATLSDGGAARPAGTGEQYVPHRHPDNSLLEAASAILRECPKRDYFTQHLLKHVNVALNQQKGSAKRTQVLGLEMYKSLEQVMNAEGLVDKAQAEPITGKQKWLVGLILTVCALIGAVAFWWIVRR